jgi:hypothetical protein
VRISNPDYDAFPKQSDLGSRVRIIFNDDYSRYAFGTIVRQDVTDNRLFTPNTIIQMDDNRFVTNLDCTFRLITPEDIEGAMPTQYFLEEVIDTYEFGKRESLKERMLASRHFVPKLSDFGDVLELRWIAIMGREKAIDVCSKLEQQGKLYDYFCEHMPSWVNHSEKLALGMVILPILGWTKKY